MDSALTLIAICGVFILGCGAFLVLRERELSRPSSMRPLAYLVFVVGAAIAAWVSYATVFAPPPLAEGDVEMNKSTLDITVPDSGRYEILVHGEMGEVHSRTNGTGSYTVEVRESGKLISAFDGTLDKHVETRRAMKRAVTNIEVTHLEGRHDVPSALHGKTVQLVVTKEQGNLKGPMHLSLVRAPPPELPILLLGCALCILGGAVDRRMKEGAKSYVGLGAGFYVAFALLVLESSHPLELKHLLAVVPMAVLLGAAGGGVFRLLVRPFVKPLPGVVPASGK